MSNETSERCPDCGDRRHQSPCSVSAAIRREARELLAHGGIRARVSTPPDPPCPHGGTKGCQSCAEDRFWRIAGGALLVLAGLLAVAAVAFVVVFLLSLLSCNVGDDSEVTIEGPGLRWDAGADGEAGL